MSILAIIKAGKIINKILFQEGSEWTPPEGCEAVPWSQASAYPQEMQQEQAMPITRRQLKLWLSSKPSEMGLGNKLADLLTYPSAGVGPVEKDRRAIELDEMDSLQRNEGFFLVIANFLSLSENDRDTLFREASSL